MVHSSQGTKPPALIEHPLAQRGFARVHMGQKPHRQGLSLPFFTHGKALFPA